MQYEITPSWKLDNISWFKRDDVEKFDELESAYFCKDNNGKVWWVLIADEGVTPPKLLSVLELKFTIKSGIFTEYYYSNSPDRYYKVFDDDGLMYHIVKE